MVCNCCHPYLLPSFTFNLGPFWTLTECPLNLTLAAAWVTHPWLLYSGAPDGRDIPSHDSWVSDGCALSFLLDWDPLTVKLASNRPQHQTQSFILTKQWRDPVKAWILLVSLLSCQFYYCPQKASSGKQETAYSFYCHAKSMNNCHNLEIASMQYKLWYNHTIGILLRQEKKLLLHIRSVDLQDTLSSRS